MESKQRRRFSREFKVEALRLASQEGVPLSQVARDLGVGANLLRRWRTAHDADPTHHGFVKPDLVAPGGHVSGIMSKDSYIPKKYKQFHDGENYFAMSGTSQSAAVVTGIVALMIQVDPLLTPDEVKFRLMAASHPAVDNNGTVLYSVFQQGAGLVDAYEAVYPKWTGFANQGYDLAADIAGTTHYRGRANRDAEGNYYLEGLDGFMWNDSLSDTMSINTWVDQQ